MFADIGNNAKKGRNRQKGKEEENVIFHVSHVLCHVSQVICHLLLTPLAIATDPAPPTLCTVDRFAKTKNHLLVFKIQFLFEVDETQKHS